MISEKRSIGDQSSESIPQDLLSCLLSLFPERLNENCSEFCLSLDTMEHSQSKDLHNQMMYEGEGEKGAPWTFDVPNDETVKVTVSGGCSLSTPQTVGLVSRQSSLTEEWFGNVNNEHPNDISVDSSLEALFAYCDWPDFRVEMPKENDDSVTENCFTDPSACQPVNCQSAINNPVHETDAHKSSAVFSTVCKSELQPAVVPENIGECSSQYTEGMNGLEFMFLLYYFY